MALALLSALALLGGEPDFAQVVRPLLAAKCFTCHGPDAATREAGLRLDIPESYEGRSRGGLPLAAGGAPGEESELLRRLAADAPATVQMPPPEAEPLTEEERALLARWVADGAPWSAHWAFEAPQRPEVPADAPHPVDAFVERRLRALELEPAQEADPATLLRRVTLDLTGLPPTPEEVRAFLADAEPAAYERAVDRLLASPHYGERMALQWLDTARYADTNGYSIDGGRHMWAWRDWVIDAYNRNLPYDRFVVEQLAGDLLPDADERTRIASGFNRNHMITHEGGTIEEEYLVEYAADRVATTSQAFLGLTMGCARCHDHKYDPFSQREYYQLFAYFNSVTDRGNDGNGGVNAVPSIAVFSSEQRAELERLEDERAAVEEQLLAEDAERLARREAWAQEAAEAAARWSEPRLEPWSVAGPFQESTGDLAFQADHLGEWVKSAPWVLREDLVDGQAHALPTQNAATYLRRTIEVSEAGPLELSLGSDDSIKVWWNDTLVLDSNVKRGVAADQELLEVAARAGANELLVKIVNYGGPGGVYFRLARAGFPEPVLAALRAEPGARSEAQRAELAAYHRALDPTLEGLRTELARLDGAAESVRMRPRTTAMVMEDRAMPRPTHVLMRGAYDQKGARVEPGTPAALPALPADAPPNRLGLARWIADPGHPLTARVAVNALWQLLFGAGLVETPEDFGVRGALPSHPELLDWLAAEFVASGWDTKALVRLLVTSATYRQASRVPAALAERDPGNRLLARGPRFRLQAEHIRDLALASSGLLVPQVGGPSARPYQPDGLWREMSHFGSTPATEQVYVQDHGDGLYRRGMYTIWKRTVPPPIMVAFDAPNRETCVVRRSRTNTPLQALALLNETGFVEATRALAQRVLLEGGETDATRLEHLFLLVLGREPRFEELVVLGGALERERERFAGSPADAEALLAVGESARSDVLAAPEHAAWTVVCGTVLNLSEAVTRG
jgi:hypothetical protein